MEVSFTVPGEPMPWERAEPSIRGGGKGKLHVTFRAPDRTAAYEQRVRFVAQAARPAGWPMRCRYRVELTICRAEPRGDVDNYTKSALDSFNPRRAKYAGKGLRRRLVRAAVPGVLWVDDGRVYEGSQRIVDVEPRDAKMVVTVTAIPVRCKLEGCGRAETFFPDEAGRCEACAAKTALKRTTPAKRAPRARRA